MDYRFLIGERFAVNGELFTVRAVRLVGDRMIAEASAGDVSRAFPADIVIEALVTEEIELFQTGGVRAG